MSLATMVHWDRFDTGHFPIQLWLILYVVTPFLVPLLWLRNQARDPGGPEEDDRKVPAVARWGLRLLGLGLLIFAVSGFVIPEVVIGLWPWTLSPLTARVMCGWFGLLGTGGLVIGAESRWSAWRIGLQSIGLWHLLVVIGALIHREAFPDGLVNWYLASVVVVLLGMVGLYLWMELARGERPAGS